MFSSNPPAHSSLAALRNPRRRQRTSSDESVKPPKAKRQRSTLRQDGGDSSAAKQHDEEQPQPKTTPAAAEVPSSDRQPVVMNDLAFRGPRKQEKRGDNADGTITLSSNDFCTASHLPSLPEQIKENPAAAFRYTISASDGYCLALSQYEAIVWPYNIPPQSLTPNVVLKFALPSPARYPDDPLPLGTFVSKSAEGNPGLMVVVPSTGKITLWETVSNAAILGLIKQRQNGIQGAIPGMLSGEVATEIINAEPSGIIIALSTGRLAHVSIRDSQGKPGISVEILRGTSRTANVGFLGGLRNVLSGNSWKRKVAATKAGISSQRGQRDIMIATSAGAFELWDIHWNNGNTLKAEVDAKDCILQSLDSIIGVAEEAQHSFEVFDFAFAQGDYGNTSGDPDDIDRPISLWVLVSVLQDSSPSYFVVELNIVGSTPNAGVVYPVHLRNHTSEPGSGWSPHLYIPKPGNSAFVVFDTAIVLLSLTSSQREVSTLPVDTNDSKSHSLFQDCIRFRQGNDYVVQGCGTEDYDADHKYPSCIVVIRNFGLVRLSALPLPISDGPEALKVTAKSRLEQAVFYGGMKTNPLDFLGYDELHSSPAELEEAALKISDEILKSSSKFVPTTVPSLEQQMKMRATALHDLAVYLKRFHVHLSHLTRWKLLWGAEKMAAQRAIWRAQEGNEQIRANKQTHLEHVLSKMGDNHKTRIDPAGGENDEVRHWFIHDTWRMDYIIPWILNGIRKDDEDNPVKMDSQLMEQVYEACNLSLATLETAFQFRQDNTALYGVSDESVDDDGVITSQYSDLPEIWTSKQINYAETQHLLDLEINACLRWIRQVASKSDPPNARATKIHNTIEQNIPRQFRVFSLLHKERTKWCAAQNSPDIRDGGKMLEKSHIEHRKIQLYKMAATGLLEEAITLAENFRDMDALVELMVELQEQIKQRRLQRRAEDDSSAGLDEGMKNWQQRIDKYFERFGEAWADAFCTRHISVGQPEALLLMQEYQGHVTRFLRSHPAYSKLSWINDIVGERDYNAACTTLQHLSMQQETDLWSKRVELSLVKLTRLADVEKSKSTDHIQEDIKQFDHLAELCNVQELLYQHILPALHGAIDQSAELQLAMEQFGNHIIRGKPALRGVLQRALAKLVARRPMDPDELINLLTLMDPVQFLEGAEESDAIAGHEFFYALRVLQISNLSQRDRYREALEMLIWRRCMVRDNWEVINKTEKKGDKEVEDNVCATALFETMRRLSEGLDENVNLLRHAIPPSRVLQTGNVIPEKLENMLSTDQRTSLTEELDAEIDVLRTYIDKGRLEEWFSWIVDVTKGGEREPSAPALEMENMGNGDI
ncbi:hypothetical protein FQN50_008156 [Emmonsiellopsis sp. PD_5]|nr:hypothetical protein FQN50_008156 [Emmonsiellopsis sp. PD_5]